MGGDHAPRWWTNSERVYPILTTIRPRTCPSTIERPASSTSTRLISLVSAWSLPRSRSEAKRFHASRRTLCGHITESIPKSDTARKMKGATRSEERRVGKECRARRTTHEVTEENRGTDLKPKRE